jgi:hypothetical protein
VSREIVGLLLDRLGRLVLALRKRQGTPLLKYSSVGVNEKVTQFVRQSEPGAVGPLALNPLEDTVYQERLTLA